MWNIDTNAPLQSILDNPECPPLLRRTLTGPISWQTRNETSVQKALTSPRAAPQWVAALLAMGVTITVEGDAGPEEMPLTVGAESPSPHILRIPPLFLPPMGGDEGGWRWGESRVARTPADEPIVAVVAVVEVNGDVVRQARVVLTGVWPEPVRLAQATEQLVGRPLDEDNIRAAAEAVEKEVAPRGDFRGSEEYRRAMAGVLTRRALGQCSQQEASDE